MQQLFYDLPDAISNTRELSSRLQYEMTGLGYEFRRIQYRTGSRWTRFSANVWRRAYGDATYLRTIRRSMPKLSGKPKESCD
jgi:error-prone DNA polymerase